VAKYRANMQWLSKQSILLGRTAYGLQIELLQSKKLAEEMKKNQLFSAFWFRINAARNKPMLASEKLGIIIEMFENQNRETITGLPSWQKLTFPKQ